uniref:Putative ovule protein n=1 Tax=Solanum chacoense TaxID=4108 RepID=A0A0V0GMZ5_SOLCH
MHREILDYNSERETKSIYGSTYQYNNDNTLQSQQPISRKYTKTQQAKSFIRHCIIFESKLKSKEQIQSELRKVCGSRNMFRYKLHW